MGSHSESLLIAGTRQLIPAMISRLVSIIFLVTWSTSSASGDLLSEIQSALADREDVSNVLDYLKQSEEQLAKDLPIGDGQTYTFFAPNNNAILNSIPQDVADPFQVDSGFRRNVLLGHFVRMDLPDAVFRRRSIITMANDERYLLARSSADGKVQLNGANILSVVPLKTTGKVYIIDQIFAKEEDIYEVLDNMPPTFGPLGQPLQNLLFSEINFALRNRNDASYIRDYLDLSYNDLSLDLPSGFNLKDENTSYTFFAPSNGAIRSVLRQDVANPFYANDRFRNNVLLAHFVRRRLSKEELRHQSVLTMANNQTAVITSSFGGAVQINRSLILEEIPLATTGTVYLISHLITGDEKIFNAIHESRPSGPWFVPFDHSSSGQQRQQVDVIAELLQQQEQKKSSS